MSEVYPRAPYRKSAEAIGCVFGRLTVTDVVRYEKGAEAFAVCDCACGQSGFITKVGQLRRGRTKSCGCLSRERSEKAKAAHDSRVPRKKGSPVGTKHNFTGMSGTRIYSSWKAILSRCYRETNEDYKHYGGRGITMCDEWRYDLFAFAKYMGDPPSPKHSIDRIDNNGNYEPGNVRWADRTTQVRNSRVAKITQEKANLVRSLHAEGMPPRIIREKTGLTDSQIYGVIYVGTWT